MSNINYIERELHEHASEALSLQLMDFTKRTQAEAYFSSLLMIC